MNADFDLNANFTPIYFSIALDWIGSVLNASDDRLDLAARKAQAVGDRSFVEALTHQNQDAIDIDRETFGKVGNGGSFSVFEPRVAERSEIGVAPRIAIDLRRSIQCRTKPLKKPSFSASKKSADLIDSPRRD
jgi:hypothetical protein